MLRFQRHTAFIIIVLLSTFFLASHRLLAHEIMVTASVHHDENEVEGSVMESDGEPLSGAEVRLATSDNNSIMSPGSETTTDTSGRYTLKLPNSISNDELLLIATTNDGHRATLSLGQITAGNSIEGTPHIHASDHVHTSASSDESEIEQQLTDLQKQVQIAQKRRSPADILSGINTILLAALLWYIYMLRKKNRAEVANRDQAIVR